MQHAEESLPAIVSSLGGKKAGEGYLCRCPAHDDSDASLSVREENGKLLLKCFAGCSYESIREALRDRGLLPEWKERVEKKKVEKKKGDGWGAGEAEAVSSSKVTSFGPTYEYHNGSGEVVFWKQRKYPKGFLVWRFKDDAKVWNLTGIAQPIFRLHKVQEAIKSGADIHIAEGEKDAVTLEGLGFVATTNHAGAAGWTLKNSAELKGAKRVVIHEDNDPAGRERIRKFKSLLSGYVEEAVVVRYSDIKEHGDATDYLELFGEEKLRARIETAEKLELEQLGWSQPDGRERAIFEDYVSFVEKLPGFRRVVRDSLTDQLMVQDDRHHWEYLATLLDYIKGHARRHGKFFTLDAFVHHLEVWRKDSKKPELRIDIPEWDKVDRLAQMRDVFMFNNVTANCWYELMLEWGAGIFRRLKDPYFQPITPVFQGAQGVGKDSLIAALTGGWGDYTKDLNVTDFGLEEALKQLHTAIVFTIPEFDKTGKLDIASLKHLLNTPYTNKRLSYDRADKQRYVRASFIASCNHEGALIDETGNRRFWLFKCRFLGLETVTSEGGLTVGTGKVLKSYPGLFDREGMEWERRQILAQFRDAANRGYRAGQEAKDEMAAVLVAATPPPFAQLMLEEWDDAVTRLSLFPDERDADGTPYFEFAKVEPIVTKLQRDFGRGRKAILGLLREKRQKRTGTRRLYRGGYYADMTAKGGQ